MGRALSDEPPARFSADSHAVNATVRNALDPREAGLMAHPQNYVDPQDQPA